MSKEEARDWIIAQAQHEEDNPDDCIPFQVCDCPTFEEAYNAS